MSHTDYEHYVLNQMFTAGEVVCNQCQHEMSFLVSVTMNDVADKGGIEIDCESCGALLLEKSSDEVRSMLNRWNIEEEIQKVRDNVNNIMTDDEVDELLTLLDRIETLHSPPTSG